MHPLRPESVGSPGTGGAGSRELPGVGPLEELQASDPLTISAAFTPL